MTIRPRIRFRPRTGQWFRAWKHNTRTILRGPYTTAVGAYVAYYGAPGVGYFEVTLK